MIKETYFIIILGLLHYCFLNGLEKILFQLFTKPNEIILRPENDCKTIKNVPTKCLGMPSGHAEITTIICYILYKYNYISLPILIIIIISMCLQRIITKRHTALQTIVGVIFGLIYSNIYLCVGISYKTVLLAVLFIFTFINIIMLKMDYILSQKVPDWVDKSMMKSITNKINVPYYLKFFSIVVSPVHQNIFLYISWKDLEYYLDKTVENILKTNIKYDAIVGIKTGGAIISDYISQKLNIKNYKIKISRKDYNCKKSTKDSISNWIDMYMFKKEYEYIICEGIDDNIEGKNIILIDELVCSGQSMSAAIEYLKTKKVNNIYPTTIITAADTLKNNYKLNTIIKSDTMNTIWSWGYDN